MLNILRGSIVMLSTCPRWQVSPLLSYQWKLSSLRKGIESGKSNSFPQPCLELVAMGSTPTVRLQSENPQQAISNRKIRYKHLYDPREKMGAVPKWNPNGIPWIVRSPEQATLRLELCHVEAHGLRVADVGMISG